MPIKIATFRTFVAVAEAGSITEAADRLGRTPSAVSLALKQFEDHLGRSLFESERKSKLTPLGRYVLDQARDELDRFTQTVQAIERYARNEAGYLGIACVPSVATRIMPSALKAFRARFPSIELDLRDIDSRSVCLALEQGRIELGLASLTDMGPTLRSEPLLRDRLGIICRPDHPLAGLERPLEWQDVEGQPFIANGICRLVADPVFQTLVARSTLFVRNVTSLVAMVEAGVGITLLPRLVVPASARGVCFLPLADESVTRDVHLLMRAEGNPTPACDAFVEVLRTVIHAALGEDGIVLAGGARDARPRATGRAGLPLGPPSRR